MPRGATATLACANRLSIFLPERPGSKPDDLDRVLTDMERGRCWRRNFAIDDFRKQRPEIKVELLSADMQSKPDVALAIAGDWLDNKGVDLPLSSAAIAVGEMAKARISWPSSPARRRRSLLANGVLNCSMFDIVPSRATAPVPGSVFRRAMPGSGFVAAAGIVARLYAARSMARSQQMSVRRSAGAALGTSRQETSLPQALGLLCDDRLTTDGVQASGRQHPVQHQHADGSLGLLSGKTECPHSGPIAGSRLLEIIGIIDKFVKVARKLPIGTPIGDFADKPVIP